MEEAGGMPRKEMELSLTFGGRSSYAAVTSADEGTPFTQTGVCQRASSPNQRESSLTMRRTRYQLVFVLSIALAASLALRHGACAAEPREASSRQGGQPAQAAPRQSPAIQVLDKAFDFGEVLEGAEVTHVFTVKNTGEAMLQITQVRPG